MIDARLKETTINWALTGSLALALQHVPVTPHDIDIQTDREGAYAIEQLLSEFVVRPVAFRPSEKIRSHFGILSIGGMTVEIMGDMQKRPAGGEWEEPVDLDSHKQLLHVAGMSIPVLLLDYEYQAYLIVGRLEKAQAIQLAIRKRNAAGAK